MTLYLSGTVTYCLFLLFNKLKDKECSKIDPISWLVIAIASSFWIVVIPISLLEIINKSRTKSKLSEPIKAQASADKTAYLETTASAS